VKSRVPLILETIGLKRYAFPVGPHFSG